jgi:hypothetical protein
LDSRVDGQIPRLFCARENASYGTEVQRDDEPDVLARQVSALAAA